MFDIGWSEIVVIGVVALIVIGPKELPAVLRAIGQWTTKIRRMAGEFQSQFQEAMREAEMADLKKQVDELGDTAKGLTSDFDPLDFKEATKWEPNPDPKTDPKPDADTDPTSGATPDAAPAAAPSEVQDATAPAEPAGASAPEPSSAQSPAVAPPAPDVGATSEPPAAVPLAEGSGRA
jgi:sec-independent protein translocase protein TatB